MLHMMMGLVLTQLAAAGVPDGRGTLREPRPSYGKCIEASGGVIFYLLDCLETEYSYQDVLLNAAYRRTMSRLTARERMQLRDSERRWLREQESACSEEIGESDAVKLHKILRHSCQLTALIARTDWLDNYHR